MNPTDWSIVDTDEEPWVVSTEHLPWYPVGAYEEYDPWRTRRRFSLRLLILCGAIGAAIAFAAWWTTR